MFRLLMFLLIPKLQSDDILELREFYTILSKISIKQNTFNPLLSVNSASC